MVDIHQSGEHRVILGDSLKNGFNSPTRMSVKYNWTPREGFNNSTGTIQGTKDDLTLSYQHGDSKYDYKGWLSEQPEDTPELALFYDKEQSAYVLEQLTASLNVNIKSGTNLSSDYIKRHAQLPKSHSDSEPNGNRNDTNDLFDGDEDETPDLANPFDYRNFLDEAKETAEKQSSRTPMPGGRTPMSGLSSPLPAGGHFTSNTPQFGPIEIKSGSKGMVQEKADRRRKAGTTTATKPTTSRKAQSSGQPKTTTKTKKQQALSQEVILDSDSDSSDDASADLSDRPSPIYAPAKKPMKSHHRNASSTSFASAQQSGRIVVDDDDDGGLEIDTGSPPPETRKRNYKIDPSAFRSGTGTPNLGRTTHRSGFNERPISRGSNVDVEMRDADHGEDEDEARRYLQSDDDDAADHNRDVDELILDDGGAKSRSPSAHSPMQAPKLKRRQSSALKSRRPKAPSPPPLQATNSMEDDDGGLAAELEAALEREQAEQEMRQRASHRHDADTDVEEGGVGLGIGIGGAGASASISNGAPDEEEDISEEE